MDDLKQMKVVSKLKPNQVFGFICVDVCVTSPPDVLKTSQEAAEGAERFEEEAGEGDSSLS